jgi:hypothetical protein
MTAANNAHRVWPAVSLRSVRDVWGHIKHRWNQQTPLEQTIAAALSIYIIVGSTVRFWQCLQPYVVEGDWKQWVWQYWRYHVDGAFPAGHVITDYTFNAQPPLYHLMMMVLASVFVPTVAANIVNWFSWVLALGATMMALRARGASIVVSLMCTTLFVRDDIIHRITAGGYPRSFGPTLSLLFLAAWLAGRRRTTLLVMVVGAALYPSVCVPMGLAFGAWTVLNIERQSLRAYVKHVAELGLAGVLVAALGQLQSLTAPSWWGPVVWAKDAGAELTRTGRTPWLPIGPYWQSVWKYVSEPWHFSGLLAFKGNVLLPWSQQAAQYLGLGLLLCCIVAAVVLGARRARSEAGPKVPLQLWFFFAGCLLAYLAARVLAFKLYLPHRMVQHTVPLFMYVLIGCVGFVLAEHLAPYAKQRARHVALAAAVILAPSFILAGDGIQVLGYRSHAGEKPLYEWISKNTKITDQFAGTYRILDYIPLFSVRQVYVNWTMAHPFRKGFFSEIDRRTVAMYDAVFAENREAAKKFATDNNIQYFVISSKSFDKLEFGFGLLFEPMYSTIKSTIFDPRFGRFFFANPPDEVVAFRHKDWFVVDVSKL